MAKVEIEEKNKEVVVFNDEKTNNMKKLETSVLKEIIESYMNKEGLSLRQFADKCNVSHVTVSNLINKEDTNPSLDVMNKIIKVTEHELKIHVSWKK